MSEQREIVWMRCPYDPLVCGADATLTEFEVSNPDDGWTGRLECANGHVFHLRQVGDALSDRSDTPDLG